MKSCSISALFCALLLPASVFAAGPAWLTDYDTALQQTKAENKIMLVDFTGSDWCGWCIKLKSEVFDTPEFAAFARENLVLLEVDFPRRKQLSDTQQKANAALQARFQPEGFPTLYLVNGNGRTLSELGYVPGGPGAFIDTMKRAAPVKWRTPGASAAPKAEATPTAPAAPAPSAAPTPSAAVMPAPLRAGLQLTGLSGGATRRFAIINNETFAPGETARVKVRDGTLTVHCREIRAKSVLVQVEGAKENQELFLNTN